jgi:hypothetical protein
MNLTQLLGKHLKSREVIDWLETHRTGPVVYEFDRLHEGTPDAYVVEACAVGVEIWFDEHQVLTTIHCYVQPAEGFSAIAVDLPGVALHATPAAVERAAADSGLHVMTGQAELPELSLRTTWVRIEAAGHAAHYEFRSGVLSRIALSLPRA